MDEPKVDLLPDEDFRRVLCVVAHPDDVEYGTSAAVARWTSRGVEVAYLLLTGGEAGMQRPPAETRVLRAGEQRAACDAAGVRALTVLDHPDGMLVYSLDLRRDIAREIRRFRPDVVVTGSWDVEFVAGLNQADHRAAGLACADAVRDADNTWVFPELAAQEGLAKWGATWLLVSGDNRPTHGVDVSGEPVERGIASLEAHAGYLGDLSGHPSPRELIGGVTAAGGRALGVANAVLFRAYRLR
ncbi:1D-myo-inositol 2-acetamido-2-deoxy-alpha-D-glucopyranoside deacetylase [Propionicimonas sp. T2.31MG-18]|uniref:PIG-L deacetylase family protein n=1 Tax=Propionicimonas sp. T2.31MG-18 TaxID=3157620 RepID=UPI0035E9A245